MLLVTKECKICHDDFEAGIAGFNIKASMCEECEAFVTKPKVIFTDYKVDRPCNRCGKPLPFGRRFNCRGCLPDGCQNYPAGEVYFGPYGPEENNAAASPEYGEVREVLAAIESLSEY